MHDMHTSLHLCTHPKPTYIDSGMQTHTFTQILLSHSSVYDTKCNLGLLFLIMDVLKYLCMEMLQTQLSQLLIMAVFGIALSILFHVVQRAHSARALWSKRPY